jgi:Uma2 family endonuclease
MSQEVVYPPADMCPDIETIDTEGPKSVESTYPEKLYRLLAESLVNNWPGPGDGRPFQVFTGVGLFHHYGQPGLCPDLMLALDITPDRAESREGRTYFTWLRGKVPDLVLEVVSDRVADEAGHKLRQYQRIGIPYYVIYDPRTVLGDQLLRSFELRGGRYYPLVRHFYPNIGLGFTLIDGVYEDMSGTWLRWCLENGEVIPTGRERIATETSRAEAERARAEAERARAEAERARAEAERARADALEARLRELGELP